jgi:hypothetical protein
MFCPKCKAEFREGFAECSDCNITLINELPDKPEQSIEYEYVDFKEFLTTNDQGEIALFKSMFESENIPYFAQGDHVSTTLAYGMNVRFLVPLKFLEIAKQVFKDFL